MSINFKDNLCQNPEQAQNLEKIPPSSGTQLITLTVDRTSVVVQNVCLPNGWLTRYDGLLRSHFALQMLHTVPEIYDKYPTSRLIVHTELPL